MADRPAPGASADAVSADLIANRAFTISRRGFDQDEVKEFLQLVAGAVRRLHERVDHLQADLADAEHRLANPKLDEDTLLRLVGEETGSILRSARAAATDMSVNAQHQAAEMRETAARETAELRAAAQRESTEMRSSAARESMELREAAAREAGELRDTAASETAELRAAAERDAGEWRAAAETETAAQRAAAETDTAAQRAGAEAETTDLRARAEAEAARVVDEARQLAGDLRTEAESVLGRSTEEAEQAVARIRSTAQETAAQVVERARREADTVRQQAEHERKLTVEGAQAVREKILGDLTRRRRVASTQIEQLRAGRERLLQSYAVVRRTLEEVNDELHRADAEAREAAAVAGRVHEEQIDDAEVAPDLLLAVPAPAGMIDAPQVEHRDDPGPVHGGATEAHDDSVEHHAGERDIDDPPDAEHMGEANGTVGADGTDTTDGRDTTDDTDGSLETADPVATSRSSAVPPPAAAPGIRPLVEAAQDPEGRVGVDDLFARLRAGRQGAVGRAREVLDEGEAPPAPAVASGSPDLPATEVPATEVTAAGEATPSDRDLEPPRSDEEEGWLQRRDEALGKTETALTRKLKRGLQDEQNDLLDRLRSLRGRPTPETLLPPVSEQRARFSRAATVLVEQGARGGADFAVGVLGELDRTVAPPAVPARVAEVVEELAAAIVTPLRHRLEQTITENGDDDQAVLVEALGGAYREWKTQRIERIAGDALAGAFARGVRHAAPPDVALRWVVDDTDGPCSDCDDNVLAGALPRDEPFPTGQLHPPAHAGCRCILVPTV